MELEFFVTPGTDDEWHKFWVEERMKWYEEIGLPKDKLELDVHPKLVQYIKLAESMTGLGTEHVRAPRLALEGEERQRVTKIIDKAIESRPSLPDYLSL